MPPLTRCSCRLCGYALPSSGAYLRCPWCGATARRCEVDVTDELPGVYGKPMSWTKIVTTMRRAFADIPEEMLEVEVAITIQEVRRELEQQRNRTTSALR